jgi:hypothetical protein
MRSVAAYNNSMKSLTVTPDCRSIAESVPLASSRCSGPLRLFHFGPEVSHDYLVDRLFRNPSFRAQLPFPGPKQRTRWAHAGTNTVVMIGGSIDSGRSSPSKNRPNASSRFATASSTDWPWLTTSTSRHLATYHGASCVTATVNFIYVIVPATCITRPGAYLSPAPFESVGARGLEPATSAV